MEQVNHNYYSHKPEHIEDEECIYDCLKTFEICTSCIQHCLSIGGKHADPKHIKLMMACAEISRLTSTMMLSKSEYAFDLCCLCAKVCEATASSCNKIDENDFMMQECSSACRKCAESCLKMAH